MSWKSLITLCLLCLLACQNENQKEDTITAKLDSLIKENQKLNEKVSQFEKSNNSSKKNKPVPVSILNRSAKLSNKSEYSDDASNSDKKYAFVLLSIVKKEFNTDKWQKDLELERNTGITIPDKGNEYNNYYVASKIQLFSNYNEETKYKFIDEIQNSLKYSSESFNMESIKKRQCLAFNTYKEASIARSKYITDDNE